MNDHADTTRAYQRPLEPPAYIDEAAPLSAAPIDGAETDETAQIRAEIEQTRGDLSETIDAIQDRLNPQTLVEQAKESVRETATGVVEQAKETVRDATIGRAEQMVSDVGATARGTGSSMMETIRQNPVPAALAAVGIGWLWMNRSKGTSGGNGAYRSHDQTSYQPSRAYATTSPSYGYTGSSYQTVRRGNAGGGLDAAQDAMRGTVNQVQDKASQLADQAQSSAGQLADQAQSGVSTLVEGTQQQAQRAQGQLQQMLQETPLAVGGIALALGAAVGLAIPETPPENQLMGEARDTLMQRAQSTAQDTMQKVQDVAQKVGTTAADTAKNEAQNAGLTGQ
jgi:ElaB/YqjD/DUF883 family membrane-anchored ribosome-binding protein